MDNTMQTTPNVSTPKANPESSAIQPEKENSQIIRAYTQLKEALKHVDLDKTISEDSVKLADRVIMSEQDDFVKETNEDLVTLRTTLAHLQAEPDSFSEAHETLITLILRIKSNSGVFGYSLASKVANYLYNFVEKHEHFEDSASFFKILNAQIDMLEHIFKHHVLGQGDLKAQDILRELEQINTLIEDSYYSSETNL